MRLVVAAQDFEVFLRNMIQEIQYNPPIIGVEIHNHFVANIRKIVNVRIFYEHTKREAAERIWISWLQLILRQLDEMLLKIDIKVV